MARALLLIDVQKIYTTVGSSLFVEGHEIAIANMNRLAKAFSAAGETIIYVRHQHKKNGSDSGRMFDYLGTAEQPGFIEGTPEVELDLRLENVSSALHIVKNRYSCFAATGLAKILQHKGVNTVVVTGFMTNFCCETTARNAHDMDFFCRLHHGRNRLPGPFRRCDAGENQVCRGRFAAGRICAGADD